MVAQSVRDKMGIKYSRADFHPRGAMSEKYGVYLRIRASLGDESPL